MTSVIAASRALLLLPATSTGGGGGGGGPGNWRTPQPAHTGIANWVKIDTTGLWTAGGGTLTGAQTLLIDGADALTLYGAGYPGEPTSASPIVTLLMSVGVHTFALGSYNWTMDCYWRGWPWTPLSSDATVSANTIFFNGGWVGNSNIPGPGNSWGDGPGWQNYSINNNGYGITIDGGPTASATFIVAPGDQGFVLGANPTGDTRAEPNIGDINFTPLDAGGHDLRPLNQFGVRDLDLFANTVPGVRSIRFDWLLPSAYTAGATVQNTSRSGVLSTLSGAGLPLSTGSPITSLPIAATTYAVGLTYTVTTSAGSATLTGTGFTAAMVNLSFVIPGAGTAGADVKVTVQTFNSATSLTLTATVPTAVTNVAMVPAITITLDDHNIGGTHTQAFTLARPIALAATSITTLPLTPTFAFASGTNVTITWNDYHVASKQPYKWPDGVTINPATNTTAASATVKNTAAGVAALSNLVENQGPADFVWVGGVGGGSVEFRYQPVSLGVGLQQWTGDTFLPAWDVQYSTVVEWRTGLYATGAGKPWIVAAGVITPPHTTAWSSTHPVAPYGTPLQSNNLTPNPPYGGGWFRIWRRFASITVRGTTYTNAWRCITESDPYAVPGNTPIYDDISTILNPAEAPFNADSGRIFGPTQKCQGANLATGPDGSSGTVLLSTTAPPFNITVTGVVGTTGFRPSNSGLVSLINASGQDELMRFTSWTSGTSTLAISHRGVFGTSQIAHAAGEQVAGLIDINVLSPGINASLPSTPIVAREWPPMSCGALASAIGPPFAAPPLPGAPSPIAPPVIA